MRLRDNTKLRISPAHQPSSFKSLKSGSDHPYNSPKQSKFYNHHQYSEVLQISSPTAASTDSVIGNTNMSNIVSLFTAVLLFTAAISVSPPTPPRRCGERCGFRICGFRRAIITNAGLPITRPICLRRNKPIGQIISLGEAKVTPPKRNFSIPISRLRINGVTPFQRNFIHPTRAEFPVPNVSSLVTRFVSRSAIEKLQGACVKVPIKQWYERGVVVTGRGCVAFNIMVPTVVVELVWDSNDDLDLFVEEPDGGHVFFGDGGGSGRLLKDVGRRNCGRERRVGGKETIVYFGVLKGGKYVVSAEHTKNCMKGETRWEVRVVVKGVLRKRVRGVSRVRESGAIPGAVVSFVV